MAAVLLKEKIWENLFPMPDGRWEAPWGRLLAQYVAASEPAVAFTSSMFPLKRRFLKGER